MIAVQAAPPATSSHQPVPMLDFTRQFAEIRGEVMAAIEEVCESQRFILGPAVTSFEDAATQACGAAHGVGCASGTDALWLALAAAGIGDLNGERDHAVITSPFSFFASASAVVRAGARPGFADIDPLTFNLSADAVREALRTAPGVVKAVLPVHLYGQCADWGEFKRLAEDSGLMLIEDAAQAFGASWNGVQAGALGDAAAFSFYPTKNLSAFGDAGLMTTRSSVLDEHARSLRAHGMRRRYFHDEMGWNSRLDSIQAAVLLVKLRYIGAWNARRREIAALYGELLQAAGIGVLTRPEKMATIADGVVLPYVHPLATPVFHQYVVRTPRRDELRAHLTARGIGSEVYYPLPLHLQEALRGLGYKAGDFPVAEQAAAEVLALPIFPEMRVDEVETVVEAMREFYAGV